MFRKIIITLIRVYQYLAPPKLGHRCRFFPSCSHYAIEVLEKYGLPKGLFLSTKRILRCNPFGRTGVDIP